MDYEEENVSFVHQLVSVCFCWAGGSWARKASLKKPSSRPAWVRIYGGNIDAAELAAGFLCSVLV